MYNISNDLYLWNLTMNSDLHFCSGTNGKGGIDQSYHFLLYSHPRNSTVSMLPSFLLLCQERSIKINLFHKKKNKTKPPLKHLHPPQMHVHSSPVSVK